MLLSIIRHRISSVKETPISNLISPWHQPNCTSKPLTIYRHLGIRYQLICTQVMIDEKKLSLSAKVGDGYGPLKYLVRCRATHEHVQPVFSDHRHDIRIDRISYSFDSASEHHFLHRVYASVLTMILQEDVGGTGFSDQRTFQETGPCFGYRPFPSY